MLKSTLSLSPKVGSLGVKSAHSNWYLMFESWKSLFMRWRTLQHVSQVSPSPNKAIIPSRGRSTKSTSRPTRVKPPTFVKKNGLPEKIQENTKHYRISKTIFNDHIQAKEVRLGTAITRLVIVKKGLISTAYSKFLRLQKQKRKNQSQKIKIQNTNKL